MTDSQVFSGEIMTCVVCGKQQRSGPTQELGWQCMRIDSDFYYACFEEFPPDGAGMNAHERAYNFVLACCLNEISKRNNEPPDPEVEQERLAIIARRQMPQGLGGE